MGYQVKSEQDNIDLVGIKDGLKIAIEIETGKSNVLKNIDKLRKSKYKLRFLVLTDKNLYSKVKRKINNGSINVVTCLDFTKNVDKAEC